MLKFEKGSHEFLVPFNGSFKIKKAPTAPSKKDAKSKKKLEKELEKTIKELRDLQRMLYAQDKYALLLVFQAMDAAGKDSTIRAVMTGVNPAGCEVYSFKQPSSTELDHDFLWRTNKKMPERGRIGIFNRSYYEEVLVVKVHPEYLGGQKLPYDVKLDTLWKQRYESIHDMERHMARNGTVVLKFWLNVGKDEQRDRFVSRIDDPAKNWKFASGDLAERKLWPKYMDAYQDALNATSKPWAPWFAIPADDKPFMRLTVAQIVVQAMKKMKLAYPDLSKKEKAKLGEMRDLLMKE